MLTSIATVSISGTLDQKLAAIAEAGFAGVEIFENDLLGFDGTALEVGQMIRDHGLVCTCYQPFRDFEGLPTALRDRALERAEAKFDVMEALGANLLLVCSSVHGEALGDTSRIVDDFRLLGERAVRRGFRVGYEALAWGRHVNDHRQAWDIVRQVDHPSIGLVLDSFHSLSRRIPIGSIASIAPEKIFLMQIADAPDMPMDYLYWSRHFRCFPSQGDLPVAEFVAAAANTGYAGPLSLEIFNDRFREWSARRVANDGWRSLQLLQDQARIAAPLPPRVQIQGIDFIEFAVDGQEAFLYAMAPINYPTRIRGMGVGAAVAFGRIGAIVGPKLGGMLKAAAHTPSQLLMDLLPIVIVGSLCALWLAWEVRRNHSPAEAF
jgi:4-hydroxyphenylpyruvate dioxygenase